MRSKSESSNGKNHDQLTNTSAQPLLGTPSFTTTASSPLLDYIEPQTLQTTSQCQSSAITLSNPNSNQFKLSTFLRTFSRFFLPPFLAACAASSACASASSFSAISALMRSSCRRWASCACRLRSCSWARASFWRRSSSSLRSCCRRRKDQGRCFKLVTVRYTWGFHPLAKT
jgi:hypothetical protein